MNLESLDDTPPFQLKPDQDLFRVQPSRARAGSRSRKSVRMAAAGTLKNRFDLPDALVAYFALTSDAAGYEVFGRRSQLHLLPEKLLDRELLCVRVSREVRLLDLTGLASIWPLLQADRYGPTQALAAAAYKAGYQGIAYLSAQQHGAICVALFESALSAIRPRWKQDLVDARTGNVHRLVQTVMRGSGLRLRG